MTYLKVNTCHIFNNSATDEKPRNLEEQLAIDEAMGIDDSKLIDMDNIDINDERLIEDGKVKKRYYHRYPEIKANGEKGIDVHLEVDKNGVRSKPKIKRE